MTLNSGSILNYQLGVPNIVESGTNDLVIVDGKLTLAGTLNITNAGGFGGGVYRLFNYTGSLTNNGLAFGTLPAGFTATDLLLQTSQAGQINLVVSATGSTDQFWDGTTTTGDGTIHGGSGTWDNVTTNWTNLDGKINAPRYPLRRRMASKHYPAMQRWVGRGMEQRFCYLLRNRRHSDTGR
jgi:fibronectin-binding autotransporter adhesin